MCWWDKELKKRLNEQGMEVIMYKRYVDDINMILRNNQRENNVLNQDENNMKTVQNIANQIHPSIETTIDYPSRNKDKKIPILDLKVWTEEIKINENKTFIILHEFYCKEVTSKNVINSRSAFPEKSKRTILTQEIIRILMNCSRRLKWETVCKHVEFFLAKMQLSGYGQNFRAQVVKSALNAYDKIIEKDENNIEPLYRNRNYKRIERMEDKRTKKANWYKGKDQNETVIFIPATPRSELKTRMKEVIDRAEVKIAIAEVPGRNIKNILQRSDPFRSSKCRNDDECLVCRNSEGGRCRTDGVTYEVKCKRCDCVYIGETSRNAYTRGKEHASDVNNRRENSPLYTHILEKHDGEGDIDDFRMCVTGVYTNDATKRQIAEAVKIKEKDDLTIMNRQEEWRQTILPRLVLDF